MGDVDQGMAAADAFVFFGATGDLAHKMIFPALYQMVKRGTLGVPVIGVASSGWGLPQLRDRARDSIARTSAGIDDHDALDRLLSLLAYVDGDYGDPSTFDALGKALGRARRPAHYLAIPPSLFATVIEGLSHAGLTHDARVIVEKPFGRDLASAQELNRVVSSAFPEDAIFRIDHFLGKEEIMNLLYFLLRDRRLPAGRGAEPPVPDRRAARDGAARIPRRGRFAECEVECVQGDATTRHR